MELPAATKPAVVLQARLPLFDLRASGVSFSGAIRRAVTSPARDRAVEFT